MDSRIEPLAALGLGPGDAKILRNAGARVTEDVLRTLVLAVAPARASTAILVMPHTRCGMAGQDEAEVHAEIERRTGLDTRSLDFSTVTDQEAPSRPTSSASGPGRGSRPPWRSVAPSTTSTPDGSAPSGSSTEPTRR